jgi:hypothetical protein
MGFGYHQARAAGGGVRESRSPRQVNRYIKDSRETREAIVELRGTANDPEWTPLIEHRIKAGCTAAQIADEIYWIRRYARMRAKGYSAEKCLRYHWCS